METEVEESADTEEQRSDRNVSEIAEEESLRIVEPGKGKSAT
jgi:hypothetical protein